ncbi:MAG: hypothetical protein ACYSTS_18885 [Planctomycetota bacterium]|jgi:hypothetical protein
MNFCEGQLLGVDKTITQLQLIIEKRGNGNNLISDITSEVSVVRQTIPEVGRTHIFNMGECPLKPNDNSNSYGRTSGLLCHT